MKQIICAVLLSAIVSLILIAATGPITPRDALASLEQRETVTLFIDGPDVLHGADASCSGSYIGHGLILTARHCVLNDPVNTQSGRNPIWAQTIDGKTLKTTLAFVSEDADFSVLHVEGYRGPAASLSCKPVDVGQSITAVGSPFGFLQWAVAHGTVATLIADKTVFAAMNGGDSTLPLLGWDHLVTMTAAIAGGDSGGPVFNDDGRIVGVIVAGGGSYGGFVPSTDICSELPRT